MNPSTTCTQLVWEQQAVATGSDDAQPPLPHLSPHSSRALSPMGASSGREALATSRHFKQPDHQLGPATATAASPPQLPATLARQQLGLGRCWGLDASYAAPICWQQARAASTVRVGAGQPQRPLPLRRGRVMKLVLLSLKGVSRSLQEFNAVYKAVTREDLMLSTRQ